MMARLRHLAAGPSLSRLVRRRVYSRETVVIYEAPVTPRSSAPNSSVEIRLATPDLVQDLSWFHDPGECRIFWDFLDAGHVGYLGYVDGRCVHRSWYVPGPSFIREHWSQVRRLGAHEGFVHYCKTAEQARGVGVFPAVLERIAQDYAPMRTTMAIDKSNAASQRAAAKAGWSPVEEATYTVWMGVRRRRGNSLAGHT